MFWNSTMWIQLLLLFLTLSTPKASIESHRITRSWYTGRWWVGCYVWYSEEGSGRAAAPPSPLLAVPNVTAHPSTASVPITVLLYDGPLLCGYSVAIKGLISSRLTRCFTVSQALLGSICTKFGNFSRYHAVRPTSYRPTTSLRGKRN